MPNIKYFFFLLALGLIVSCSSQRENFIAGQPDFRTSVETHLEAVETRNFEAFRSTLTSTNNLNVIFPGGTILDSTDAVLDFHKTWFQDDQWVFDPQIVKVIEGTTQSTALVKYSFKDNPTGVSRQAWLVLTFQLESNKWRLIHDQNTRIEE